MGKPDALTRRSGTEKSEAKESIFKDENVQEEEHHFIREAAFDFCYINYACPPVINTSIWLDWGYEHLVISFSPTAKAIYPMVDA